MTAPDAAARAALGAPSGATSRPEPPAEPLPVVLAGARGHGRWHLANIRRLQEDGLVRLAGICELTPLTEDEFGGGRPGGRPPEQSADFGALLESTGARIAVVCTPIHTHTDLALAAAGRGVHLLLEKPPAPSCAEYLRMADGVAAAGVACQIGFQSLGSHAVPAIRALVADGAIGRPTGIGAAGAWVRPEDYFRRAPWAGRRRLDGVDVIDGALTNPLAHAVATALALAGSTRAEDATGIETELLRANDIESDDTSCVRVTTAQGLPVTVAATLCAERADEPYVLVHGTSGRITFWYKQDRVLVQRAGHGPEELRFGRTDLLENLVDHLVTGAPLLVTPDGTGAFMKVVEAIRRAPDPAPLPAGAWHHVPGENRRVVPGVDGLVAAAADTLSLYSELGASWALPAPQDVPESVRQSEEPSAPHPPKEVSTR
ncbi:MULTISPECIES: Gfo/Idh/MocA family protein [unclassified Streptomyces]|uniref:Gfo/Idh/MocA family protein n=1 Tax=unclassified Streptomyces TaxID=2593676 RepID=UPI00073BEABD|nr:MULTISPECIES: Gfo/Idh/MocA family oxidoreductase [unclassified Streptomyces]ODA72616.1 Oxidoreductase family, NAD-binding Rossmann fold [Streptomyces sp. AVP053U2]